MTNVVMKRKANDMGILKDDMNKREEVKLLGALLPLRLDNYLSVYALAKHVTKTQIVKELLEAWMIAKRVEEPDELLLQAIIERSNQQCNIAKIHNPELALDAFKLQLQRELLNKGISKTYVQLILIKVKK